MTIQCLSMMLFSQIHFSGSSMSATTEEFTGPINNAKQKADLIDIINALCIKENTGTIKELISCIQKHLNECQDCRQAP